MKTFLSIFALVFAFSSFAQDVQVEGYYRQDGTYVAPHTRSAPDSYRWNNYGEKQEESEPLHFRDQDDDGLYNQYDRDDDDDGIFDDHEADY